MSHPLLSLREGPVARLRLNRPELHNAFDAILIAALTGALEAVGADDGVRVVVIEGEGASFSAGADLNWMRGMAAAGEAENREDALALARLMRTLNELPKPTLARVQGAAFGGGVGLVACCDIAIAAPQAKFGLTESKLGLLPAVISPYVIEAIGARQSRRWFASAEIFDAATALRIGLVDELVEIDAVSEHAREWLQQLLSLPRSAMLQTRALARADLIEALRQEHIELDRFVESWYSPDTQIALKALVAKLGK
ncbi:enoyl-CoA hydratase-related protein [Lysobacter sp. 2RAB21]